jgi:hypothetical protein
MTGRDHAQSDLQDDVSAKTGRRREDEPGAAGHPAPGSGHDDGKTETVDQGPPVEKVDGVPGAHAGRRESNRDA